MPELETSHDKFINLSLLPFLLNKPKEKLRGKIFLKNIHVAITFLEVWEKAVFHGPSG